MADLTPKERVLRLLKKEPIDTMPFFSGMGMVVMPGIKKSGYKFATVHTSAERLAMSAIWSARLMGFDCVVVPYDMTMESEAMGNQISLYEDSEDILYPTIPHKQWKSMEEVVVPDDIMSRGRLPIVAEAIKIIKKEAPELPVGAWVLGPFTQIGQILELDMILKAVFKEKAKVEALLAKMSDLCILEGRTWQEAGCDYVTLREPGVAADLLSPRTFRDVIKPCLTRIIDGWKSPKLLHICGSTDPLIEMMNQCHADGLTVDIKCNIKEARKKLGDDVLLMGNLDTYNVTCKPETTKEEVVAAIKQTIDNGVDAVMPGCDLWPDIKEENMLACVETTHDYGRKPSPAVGRL